MALPAPAPAPQWRAPARRGAGAAGGGALGACPAGVYEALLTRDSKDDEFSRITVREHGGGVAAWGLGEPTLRVRHPAGTRPPAGTQGPA